MIGNRFNTFNLSEQVASAEQRLEQAEQRLEQAEQRLEQAEQAITTLEQTVETLEQTVDTLSETLDAQKTVQMIDGDELSYFDIGTGLGSEHWQGWAICDGQNNTPDLRGRFIAGYDSSNTDYDIDATGGEEFVTLTEAQLPTHVHEIPATNWSDNAGFGAVPGTTPATIEGGGDTSEAGGDEGHENRPPYYVLAFIKKL